MFDDERHRALDVHRSLVFGGDLLSHFSTMKVPDEFRERGSEKDRQSSTHRLSDEGESPAVGAENAGPLDGGEPLREDPQIARRTGDVRSARRSSLRERRNS